MKSLGDAASAGCLISLLVETNADGKRREGSVGAMSSNRSAMRETPCGVKTPGVDAAWNKVAGFSEDILEGLRKARSG